MDATGMDVTAMTQYGSRSTRRRGIADGTHRAVCINVHNMCTRVDLRTCVHKCARAWARTCVRTHVDTHGACGCNAKAFATRRRWQRT